MNNELVTISKTASVNPKHVVAVVFDTKKLKTIVALVGGTMAFESDYKFKDTVDLINGHLPIVREKE